MIVADVWLLDMALRSSGHKKVATVLLRAQVRTYNRTGHYIDLSGEHMRRKILNAARWGRVAAWPANCKRCGWAAPLTLWVMAANREVVDNDRVLRDLYSDRYPEDTAFLRPCPGEQMARDMMSVLTAPAERGVR